MLLLRVNQAQDISCYTQKLLFRVESTLRGSVIFFYFFSYLTSSGIAPCVGTVGTVHMTPTLDVALLYVVNHDRVTTTSSRTGTDLIIRLSRHDHRASPLYL